MSRDKVALTNGALVDRGAAVGLRVAQSSEEDGGRRPAPTLTAQSGPRERGTDDLQSPGVDRQRANGCGITRSPRPRRLAPTAPRWLDSRR